MHSKPINARTIGPRSALPPLATGRACQPEDLPARNGAPAGGPAARGARVEPRPWPVASLLLCLGAGAGAILFGATNHPVLCGFAAALPVAGLASHLRERIARRR